MLESLCGAAAVADRHNQLTIWLCASSRLSQLQQLAGVDVTDQKMAMLTEIRAGHSANSLPACLVTCLPMYSVLVES